MSDKKNITHSSGKKGVTGGGPQGAHEGGASRGAARLEPSHVKQAAKEDKGLDKDKGKK